MLNLYFFFIAFSFYLLVLHNGNWYDFQILFLFTLAADKEYFKSKLCFPDMLPIT